MPKPENKIWTILEILKWTENHFKEKNITDPRLNTEILLSHILNFSRVQLYTNYDKPLSDTERAAFKLAVKRRLQHEPVQYITGFAYFMGLSFKVNTDVLIPRMETEQMVQTALELIKQNNFTKVLDIGTGSGAIALSLAKYLPAQIIWASDISEKALLVAQENSKILGLETQLVFRQGNLLEPWVGDFNTDDKLLILANLPYVREKEWLELDIEVRNHEPKLALVAGDEGLACYQALFTQLKKLNCDFILIIELGIDQVGILKGILSKEFPSSKVNLIKDLSKKDRFLVLKNNP